MAGKTLNIGLIGFGTIGTGVVKTIKKNKKSIKKRTGLDLNLKKIADTNLKRKREVNVDPDILTQNADEIINDNDIDVVIELIGGYNPAKEFILKALENKKYVVTANKALLSKHGREILNKAKENNVDVYFEASVGGGIPLLLPTGLSLGANQIQSFYGILNGTCNYILSKMEKENKSFEKALKEAQDKGFAEADPTLDIDGSDSMHKLVILSSLAFGCFPDEENILLEGIQKITKKDIEYAKELGYKIKLLAIGERTEKKVSLRVQPTLIPEDHLLSSVKNEMNAVFLRGDVVGDLMFYGKGAGMMPTASAVVADLINVGQDILNKGVEDVHLINLKNQGDLNVIGKDDFESCYFLKFMVEDKVGLLSKLSKILSNNNVSIASISQKERKKNVPVFLTTHLPKEDMIKKSIREAKKLKGVKDVKMIRLNRFSEN